MTEEEITDIAVATKQIKNLCDSINALVDEKHALMAANDRLANELKACIAEKGELQKQLALKSGMGIQENNSALFTELKRELGQK
jgi:hypothetical protein